MTWGRIRQGFGWVPWALGYMWEAARREFRQGRRDCKGGRDFETDSWDDAAL